MTCEPVINEYFRHCSLSVSPSTKALDAFWLMRQKGLQYLPVKSGKRVVGLIPSRRLRMALCMSGKHVPKIADLMIRHPAVAAPDTGLFQVLDNTSENAAGCTVIQEPSGRVTGIFTPADAVSAYRSLLPAVTGGDPKVR